MENKMLREILVTTLKRLIFLVVEFSTDWIKIKQVSDGYRNV